MTYLVQKAKIVGDQNPSPVLEHAVGTDQVVKDLFSYVSVNSTERIVHENNVGVVVCGAGKTNTLLLAATKIYSILT